jgi:hypothetical protein
MTNSTIKIPLSKRGKKNKGLYETIVSHEDADLADHNWTALVCDYTTYGYRQPTINNEKNTVLIHVVILERVLNRKLNKGDFCDHIDGNGLNNQRDNLRLASKAQNNRNSAKRRGTSQYKGVHWDKPRQKWKAQISLDGKPRHLGRFDNEYEAHLAYRKAAKELYGDFTNFG